MLETLTGGELQVGIDPPIPLVVEEDGRLGRRLAGVWISADNSMGQSGSGSAALGVFDNAVEDADRSPADPDGALSVHAMTPTRRKRWFRGLSQRVADRHVVVQEGGAHLAQQRHIVDHRIAGRVPEAAELGESIAPSRPRP